MCGESGCSPRFKNNIGTTSTSAEFPDAFQFLFQPARFKVAYGGRGSGKSWAFARALLIQGAQKKLRILCARETQKSISDSVHKLLADQIKELGLSHFYTVQKATIRGANGTEIFFAGLHHNVSNIKSAEKVDRCWCEEAQTLSRASIDVLVPTIRAKDSELWFTWNPVLRTDEIWRRFVENPPPDAMVRKVNFDSNPWFPEVLRNEMEHCKATDPDGFNHIWLGLPVNIMAGAIYEKELRAVEAENRITKVPYDATKSVMTFWDLGFGDRTSIWFAQAHPFEYRLIDFVEGSGQPLKDYLKILQSKPYVYGTDYLPHDARAKTLATGRSIEELMREAGRRVQIVPMLSVSDGINAARTIFPQCWFDAEKCADGLQALRHYRYGEIKTLGTPTREPLHDNSSHAADAFRYFAVGIRAPKKEQPKTQVRRPPVSVWS